MFHIFPKSQTLIAAFGVWRRTGAMVRKEFHQLRRDRVSCALIILAPLFQTLLYGYAINTTPRHLPTALLLQEQSDVGRSIVKALENSSFFDFTYLASSETEIDRLVETGSVKFAIEIPVGFERALRRGDRPQVLFVADATDPIATNAAIGAVNAVMLNALQYDHHIPTHTGLPTDVRIHARYNPESNNALNVIPGLVGTILTLSMVTFTALSVTREIERNTMEGLLSRPIRPVEMMFGKLIPYIVIGMLQGALIIAIGVAIFGVPVLGGIFSLTVLTMLFIMSNLAIGYFFSTIAGSQLQALQMSSIFLLPNMILSGFVFPIEGFPKWARWISEFLPLTHYLRIVRGVMLKGLMFETLQTEAFALAALMLVAVTIAAARFRRTLD